MQKNIVVVTNGGNPFETSWLKSVPAFVHCWYLGSMGGEVIANVLTGKVNPSGKLPVTWGARLEDYSYYLYGKEGYPGVDNQVYYKEGIYVGYRHFDTHKVKPAFPFGFGLSYTTFAYGKATATTLADGKVKITCTVKNTGNREGKETVQLYVGKKNSSIDRPVKELKDFAKVSLGSGESTQVSFTVNAEDLKYFDENIHDWKLESGKYIGFIGTSETDIRSKIEFEM